MVGRRPAATPAHSDAQPEARLEILVDICGQLGEHALSCPHNCETHTHQIIYPTYDTHTANVDAGIDAAGSGLEVGRKDESGWVVTVDWDVADDLFNASHRLNVTRFSEPASARRAT